MSRVGRSFLFLVAVTLVMAAPAQAQIDLYSEIVQTTEGTVKSGEVVNYTVTVGNGGDINSPSPYSNITFPPNFPKPVADLTDEDVIAIEDSVVSDNGLPLVFLDTQYCEGIMFQWQCGLPDASPCPIPNMGPGAEHSLAFDVTMPDTKPLIGVFNIDSPASIAGPMAYEPAACGVPDQEACSDLDCFGPRMSLFPAVSVEMELGDDGSDLPNEGCNPLVGFTPGNIALIDRGTCEFGQKAVMAEQAGASAIIIMNSATPSPDTNVVPFGGGDFGALVNIPVVMITQNQGAMIKAVLAENPTATFGAQEAVGVTWRTSIWDNDGGDDADPTNDSSTYLTTIDFDVPPPEPSGMYYLAAAAKAAGAEGSFWVTDVVINNNGDSMATYKFLWLPRGADNSTPTESAEFTLDAGTNVVYADVLGSVFGADGVAGALAISGDSDDLLVTSRTFNDAGEDGTFGQGIPGIHEWDLIQTGETQRIVYFAENDAFRSNMGLMNGTMTPTRVSWKRYLPDGSMAEEGFTDLPPYSNKQLNSVFADEAPVVGGYVDVWTTTEDAAFTAYGSVVDNNTGDPTTVMPVAPADTATATGMYLIPAAAKAAGAAGSFWVTDVIVNNGDAISATFSFSWLPRGADNSAPTMSGDYTLEAGANMVFADVLGTVFGADGVAGALAITSDSNSLAVTSRTFNDAGEAGTFGQGVPGYDTSDLIMEGETERIIYFAENDAFRSNLGVASASTTAIRVFWERFTPDGTSVEEGFTDLGPWSNKQLNGVFGSEAPVNGGYVDLWTQTAGAAFTAYGSVVDNNTGDPTTVLP